MAASCHAELMACHELPYDEFEDAAHAVVDAITIADGGTNLPAALAKCQDVIQPNGAIVGSKIGSRLRSNNYKTLVSVIPRRTIEQGPSFLCSIDGRLPVTHTDAHAFIREFGETLHSMGIGRGHRVALCIPNGVELALGILAISQWASCVPLSSNSAASELKADLERCGADLVIGPYSAGPLPTRESSSLGDDACESTTNNRGPASDQAIGLKVLEPNNRDWTVHHHVHDIADDLSIPFVGLVPSPFDCTFRMWIPPAGIKAIKTRSALRTHQETPLDYNGIPTVHGIPLVESNPFDEADSERIAPNIGPDEALVLFTSGTTGNKKLVPHCLGDILTAAVTIALSWELTPKDVNCNLMPLFHVGGIIRQVYSPLVSGSSVICCPSFDADLFWALLKRRAFNWYYAAPTMHQIILQTGREFLKDDDDIQSFKLRMIANAAGGLLPSLAEEMRQTFGAVILPSYGMTECMPISSPPATYDLSKPGTSGVPVGPEVAIFNLSTMEPLPPRQEGPICVRGEPCFRGYGILANDPDATKPESFMTNGWFNTGDRGFFDEDGFIYITGRYKEVINRGGEIIAPMEVEEAVISHPDIKACAAFAAKHDVLQETVGVVIVTDEKKLRTLDLPTLHRYIADKLATPKWPQVLVFMDGGLPKSHTNKLLRVKLGNRLGLPEVSDKMTTWERTFEAACPPQGTPLDHPIASKPVSVANAKVEETLRKLMMSSDIWVIPHPTKAGALVVHCTDKIEPLDLIQAATEYLHRYEVPTHICTTEFDTASIENLGSIVPKPKQAVSSILDAAQGIGKDEGKDLILSQVQDIFIDLLDLEYIPAPDHDFFQIGGSSMTASQLASRVRRAFGVGCTGAEVFHHSTCQSLVDMINSRRGGGGTLNVSSAEPSFENRNAHAAPFGSERLPIYNTLITSIVQLIPMFVIFPVWQVARYLLFFETLMRKSQLFPNLSDRDFSTYLWAYVIFQMLWKLITPLIFVAIKWTVIGKYRAGRYPIGGNYYLRWWIVDVCRKLFLKGFWGSNEAMLRLYYRMLGANIGKGARISEDCELAEFDLVHVGEEAAVDSCTLRGFGVDNGAMLLGKVCVGHNASVGIKSVVAPNTSVSDGKHLGPGTSSYDNTPGKSHHPKHARVNRMTFAEPSLVSRFFFGFPLMTFVTVVELIPPMMCTLGLLYMKSRENSDHFFSNWNELMDWLCDPNRIPFFFAIRIARATLSPFFYIAAALAVKALFIGRIEPHMIDPSIEYDIFRIWIMSKLFSRKKVQAVTDLIGRHYELVSILYRMLGAKIGKRVFWPGNQPVCNGLYDLLEIGDDVVFGSRSTFVCRSVDRCSKIILCAGANVSDNCIILPGSVISKNAVLGSNSICSEGAYLPAGSVWFGNNGAESQCLDPGDSFDSLQQYQSLLDKDEKKTKSLHPTIISSEVIDPIHLQLQGDETTVRPVGQAVYEGKTKGYWFPPVYLLIAYAWIVRIFTSVLHTTPLLMSVQFASVLLYSNDIADTFYRHFFQHQDDANCGMEGCKRMANSGRIFNEDTFFGFERDFDNEGHYHNIWDIFWSVLKFFLIFHFLRVVLWLFIELAAKWSLMRRRKAGRYNYNASSYALRWELYQLTCKIRKISRLNLLEFISGSSFMNWYFRANGGKIGKNVCLYPSGADPFMPEPDLVTVGDRSVVDCASMVCHLNTRGNFELAPIVIGKECTLRTRSRVQQGVRMEEGSMLLEKSIAMTGEVLDAHSIWQGGPATMWFSSADSIPSSYTPPCSPAGSESSDIEMGSID